MDSLRQQLQLQQLQQREIREFELSTDQILNRFSHARAFTGIDKFINDNHYQRKNIRRGQAVHLSIRRKY